MKERRLKITTLQHQHQLTKPDVFKSLAYKLNLNNVVFESGVMKTK